VKNIAFFGGFALALVLAVDFGSGAARAQSTSNQWQGVYAGINIGAAKNHDTGLNTCTNPSGVVYGAGCFVPAYGITSAPGGIAGVQVGYNWQFGRWVVGPELDYDASTMSGRVTNSGPILCVTNPPAAGTFNSRESIGSFGTARLRVGVTLSPKALLYATAGYALANANLVTRYDFSSTGGSTYNASVNTQRSGFAEGLGGEWQVSPRTSVKLEVLEFYLRSIGVNPPQSPFLGYFAGKNFEFHGAVLRAGVNIKI
jgi:outer membrane immunogenic protein